MLINEIVEFCNSEYRNADTTHVCRDCNHPSKCSGSCKNCLEQVHFPSKYPNGKIDYDCENMINFYVCDYINKYASEMLYLLRKSEKLKEIDEYHILSIGCGAAPDLMAFEQYVRETDPSKRISYLGFDINNLWKPVHDKIDEYNCSEIIKTRFKYEDVIQFFDDRTVKEANVIVLQYVISHFYNTEQINRIKKFFSDLIKNVVELKDNKKPFIILINDVNSYKRSRNFFMDSVEALKSHHFHGQCRCFYFDYKLKDDGQRYGDKHPKNNTLFDLSEFDLKQYEP